jgi:hypothetical protein
MRRIAMRALPSIVFALGVLLLPVCVLCVCDSVASCDAFPACWAHGTCATVAGTPACVCDQGWSGADCSTPDCPCVHGSCVSGTCVCHPGWRGTTCNEFRGIFPGYPPVCTADGECRCGSAGALCTATAYGTVAPDLAIFASTLLNPYSSVTEPRLNLHVRRVEVESCDCRIGGTAIPAAGTRYQLAVSVPIINIGTANLFVGAPDTTHYVRDCLGRVFFQSLISMDLIDSSDNVVQTHLADYLLYDNALYGAPIMYFNTSMQGLTKLGGMTIRGETNECVWFDITGLPAGVYTVRVTVNPLGTITESDYSNNVASNAIDLTCPGCAHGVCDHGMCICDAGYTGPQCADALEYSAPACTGDCSGKFCGSDGCGGVCGTCDFGTCSEPDGTCIASLACNGSECDYAPSAGIVCGVCYKPGEACQLNQTLWDQSAGIQYVCAQ